MLLAQNSSSSENAWMSASAIRILARKEEIPKSALNALIAVFEDTKLLSAQVHLMKALAAFGRLASDAELSVLAFIADLHITSDETFWAFDSALHTLSYIGEDLSFSFLEVLDEEKPSRVLRSDSVYVGTLKKEERAEWYAQSLKRVFERIKSDDAGTWNKKMTQHQIPEGDSSPQTVSPWMTR